MEKHYYDPGTMISATGNSRTACWHSIRKECRERGFPLPAFSDLVEVVFTLPPDDDVEPFCGRLTWGDWTPWKEFSPDMLKDGMELLVRTSDGSHTHCLYRESREFGDRLILMNVGTGVEFPLQEITHAFVINPPKP